MLLEKPRLSGYRWWLDIRLWLWAGAVLLAVAAIAALLLLRPLTRLDYTAAQLTAAVPEKFDSGIYDLETDNTGQQFRWLSDKATLIFPVNSNKPIKITFRLRNGSVAGGSAASTTFSLNYQNIGTLTPATEFQDYVFRLVPPYTDNHRLEFKLDTDPVRVPPRDGRKLGNLIASVSIDLSETWSPLIRPSRGWLFWLLPVLVVMGLSSGLLARRQDRLAQVAGYGAVLVSGGLVGLMWLWLGLLARVSYNGEANRLVFWSWTISAAYLSLFFGYIGLVTLGWGKAGSPGLCSYLKNRASPIIATYPVWAALIGLFLVNLGLTGIFYGKVWLEAGNLEPIVRYWDGPEYLVIAHGFYAKDDALLAIPNFGLKAENYWTAHFPGYPLLLRLAWLVVGWQAAGLVVNLIVTSLFAFVMWRLLRDFGYTRYPFWLACVCLVLPVRWLVYHTTGASEPLMLLGQMLSIYFFKKERYWLAGLAGSVAVFARPPGFLLWFGYLAFIVWEGWQLGRFKLNWRAIRGTALIPLALLGVFAIFAWRYGDFLAYFHIEDDVKHIGPIPLSNLASGADSGPGLIYYYLLETVGLVLLWKQRHYDIFWFGLSVFGYTLFLLYSDVLRYSLPAFPLVLAIPFASYLTGKTARWLAIPVVLVILVYSWGILNINLAKLDTWDMLKAILAG